MHISNECMYVCMHSLHTCVYVMNACMYVHMYAFIYVLNARMDVCICAYIYIYIYIYIYKHACMYICMYLCVCVCVQDRCRRAPGGLLHSSKNRWQKSVGIPSAALPCGSTQTFGVGCALGEPRVYTPWMASAYVSTSMAAPADCSVCRR